jgi:hypothetical protein
MTEQINDLVALLEKVDGIKFADLQRGQFKQPSQNYPTLFPTALLTVENIEFSELGFSVEEAEFSFDVDVYLDGIKNTHNNPLGHFSVLQSLRKTLKNSGCNPNKLGLTKMGFDYVQYTIKCTAYMQMNPEPKQKIKPKASINVTT